MKPSLISRVIFWLLKITNFKAIIEKQARTIKPRPGNRNFVPKSIGRRYSLTIQTLHDKEIATFAPREQTTRTHLIFFHGGAYIFEAAPYHWAFARKIVDKSFCRMTLVDYPLAPEANYRETFDMAEEAYDLLIRQFPGDRFFLMGDSAGGGLALALSQKLMTKGPSKLPAGNILLSPWLDLTMSNPQVKALEPGDHILTVEMLRIAGAKYADGDAPAHYLLSPVNGPFEGLPKTLVFYGTEELFYADCTRMKAIAEAAGAPFTFREYQGMQHDWAILPIPESTRVVDEICSFIKE